MGSSKRFNGAQVTPTEYNCGETRISRIGRLSSRPIRICTHSGCQSNKRRGCPSYFKMASSGHVAPSGKKNSKHVISGNRRGNLQFIVCNLGIMTECQEQVGGQSMFDQ